MKPENLIACNQEVMLKSKGGSAEEGHESTFYHSEPLPFKRGVRFQMLLVEIADDEQAIDQNARAIVEREINAMRKAGTYAKQAGMLCKEPEFHRYLLHIGKLERSFVKATRIAMAAQYLYDTLGIKSRREIDHGKHLIDNYNFLVMRPFAEWVRKNPRKRAV